MTLSYTTPGTARDRNGTELRVGQSVAFWEDGHIVHARVTGTTFDSNIGWLVMVRTKTFRSVVVCAEIVSVSRKHVTRRMAS